MFKSKKNLILVSIAVLSIGLFAFYFLHVAKKGSKGSGGEFPEDPLSRRYEYWTLDLNGQFRNNRCDGEFKGQYTLHILVPGSLSQTLAKPPVEAPVEISAEGSYVGQEEVSRPSAKKDFQVFPSPISPTNAKVVFRWYKNLAGSRLDIHLESKGSLINAYCAEKLKVWPHPVRQMDLISNMADQQSIAGTWTPSPGESDGVVDRASGQFRLIWQAGGNSGRPIPGPANLQYKVRADKTVLLQWTAMPLAKQYDIYFSPGETLNPAKLIHTTVETPFAALELKEELPYTFAVSAHIDGKETVVSSKITASTASQPSTQ